MPSRSPSPTWLPWLAAVLVPAAILSTWAAVMGRPTPARQAPTELATTLDARLQSGPVQLLVLGNSTANRNLDLERLGTALGTSAIDVAIPSTMAPTWTVVLRDRVYGQGLRPELIVVAGNVANMLALQPPSDKLHHQLLELADGTDPVLERGGGLPAWSRTRSRTSALRSGLVDGLRGTTAGLVFAPAGPGSLLERGAARVDTAAAEVLGPGGQAAAGLEGWLATPTATSGAGVAAVDPGESFVADLVELARSHGTEIVFVRLAEREPERSQTPLALSRARALTSWLNDARIPIVDLSSLGLRPDQFVDPIHTTPEGARITTDALVEVLASLDTLDFVPAPLPKAPVTLRRTGEVPELDLDPADRERRGPCRITWTARSLVGLSPPVLQIRGVPGTVVQVLEQGRVLPMGELGDGCSGTAQHTRRGLVIAPSTPDLPLDAYEVRLTPEAQVEVRVDPGLEHAAVTPRWWGVVQTPVYPGTAVELALPEGWLATPHAVLQTSAVQVVEGQPSPSAGATARAPTLSIDGVDIELQRDGDRWAPRHPPAPGPGPALVRWSSDPDGPWLMVRELRVGDAWAVGSPRTVAPRVSLLAEGTFHSAPPSLEQGPAQVHQGLATAPVVWPDWLTLSELSDVLGAAACVPIAVGDALLQARARADTVTFASEAAGSEVVWHPERRCTWWPSDAEGPPVGLTRAEARSRKRKGPPAEFFERQARARWLYPGDVARLPLPELRAMHAPPAALQLLGHHFGTAEPLQVELLQPGRPSQPFTVTPAADGRLHAILPLNKPLPRGALGTVVVHGGPGLTWLSSLDLVE